MPTLPSDTVAKGISLAHSVLSERQPIDLYNHEVREMARALLTLDASRRLTSPVPSDDPIDGPQPDKIVGGVTFLSDANTRQVAGEHYKSRTGLQHWDLVVLFDWDYFQGQITKYLMRWRKKNGVQDLEKAAHFLEKYIEVAKKEDTNARAS